jgi:hypothetical protein
VGKHAWWRAHLMQSSTELDIERSGITTRSQQTKTESVARKCRRCDCAPHLLDQADVAVLRRGEADETGVDRRGLGKLTAASSRMTTFPPTPLSDCASSTATAHARGAGRVSGDWARADIC